MHPNNKYIGHLTDHLDYIFVSASGILGITIGLNSVSTHGICTAAFAAIAAILGFATSSVRTLGRITWLAWVGLPCILAAGTFLSLYIFEAHHILKFSSSSDRVYRRWRPRPPCLCTADSDTLVLRFQDHR